MYNIVELKKIHLSYYNANVETLVIKDLDLTIAEGEFVSIVGPSGCGKSTLLSIIAGLVKPTKGEVLIKNNLDDKDTQIGYMLQKDYLLEWRTIFKNVILGLEIQGKLNNTSKEYALQLLKEYGLENFKNYYPKQLSGGMRQRVALIRTLAINPEILLLDEPFSALDYQTRLFIADEIGTIIRKQHKTAILVTHDISEAIAMADRVIVFSKKPASIKKEYEIKLTVNERTALKSRESPEFKDYFNMIWKELDVHV